MTPLFWSMLPPQGRRSTFMTVASASLAGPPMKSGVGGFGVGRPQHDEPEDRGQEQGDHQRQQEEPGPGMDPRRLLPLAMGVTHGGIVIRPGPGPGDPLRTRRR